MRTLERERRFLVPRLPPGLRQCPKKEIDQGYLAVQRETVELALVQLGAAGARAITRAGPGLPSTHRRLVIVR